MQIMPSAPRRLASVLESVDLDSSPASPLYRNYRDSIRRVAVGPCTSARFFFPPLSDEDAAEEGSYCCSSGSSSLHSRLSFSSAEDLSFRGCWTAACLDGVHELHAIALQMVNDGYMQGLIRAFRGASSSAELEGGSDHDELLLERWFKELDVEWVLHTGEDRLQLQLGSLQDLMERWTRALLTMVQVLCITLLKLRTKRPTVGGVRKAIQHFLLQLAARASAAAGDTVECDHEEVTQFARFAEASILRMLAVVEAVAVAALNDHQVPDTLPGMLQVCACVADASPTVLALFKVASNLLMPSSRDKDQMRATIATTVFDAMNGVFLRKRKKLSDAIWSMMEMAKGSFLTDDCWQVVSLSPEASGVHETTKLMMNYIMLLRRYDGALNIVLQDHHFSLFVSKDEGFNSVVNLVMDMISCLEKQLEETSYSFADPGLRCIFLMNNCDFVSQKVDTLDLPSWTRINGCKIQKYIEDYLDASWAPVLSRLFVDMPFGLRRYTSLSRFESEFQTTYDSQRLWKVPNPELRKRLRRAIIEKVIPWYARYLEQRLATGKSKTTPSSTPDALEQQLEELFEG